MIDYAKPNEKRQICCNCKYFVGKFKEVDELWMKDSS